MKVHRIITTIEVENDDHSITTVELTKLNLDDIYCPIIVSDINTNGGAEYINQVYKTINECKLDINDKLKGIVNSINDGLDDCKRGMK